MDPLHGKRLDEEIRHHIEERTERLVEQGMERSDARREALRAFGDVEAVRAELERIEEPPRGRVRLALGRVRADLTFALRQMKRNPGFAVAAILTLALGLGAATAIFGLVQAVVLDPLPYPEADRLVVFNEVSPDGSRFSVSQLNYEDFRERVRSLEYLAATSRADLSLVEDGTPVNLVAAQVTGGFFPLFGAEPVRGRVFTDAEAWRDATQVAVLSHSLWTNHLGADPAIVGRTLSLDGVPYEVVGIAAPSWSPMMETDLWIPMAFVQPDRDNHDVTVVGRLAPDATLESAMTDVRDVAAQLAREFPASNREWSATVRPLKDALLGPARIQAGWVLLGAVGLLLLLACASVSNLLLARATTRHREMELRRTLGAGIGRLTQQLLTESLALAGAGAALGIAIAYGLLPILRSMAPTDTPRIAEAAVDLQLVLIGAGMALVTGLIFGTAPGLTLLRRSKAAHAGLRVTASGERIRAALVAAQVAVSLTLIFGTGALGASFLRLQAVDSGMDGEHTFVVPLMLSGDRYDEAERRAALDLMHERLAAIPGVEAVGTTNIIPFSGSNSAIVLNVEGRASTPETAPLVRWRAVSPGWFDAARVEVLQGRALGRGDGDAGAEDVVVLSASLARTLFGDAASAIGRNVAFGWDGTNWRRVVGVVPDVEDLELATTPPLTLYFAAGGFMNWAVFLARYQAEPDAGAAEAIRRAIWSVDPGLPVPSVERLGDRIQSSVASPRFNLLVMGVFGGIALLLSLTAIYGLILFAVRQRTREIGVRLALGAESSGVVRLLLRRGTAITLVGVAAGVGLSLVLGRYLDALLFGEGSRMPILLAAAGIMAAAATLATWLPARRATRVDPREALTAE